ncbi:hypothetical protein [Sphingomonas profundi]|uniref:hypothetical protein n=1 Tax=Alterirhizorhabdus profundi TaxID=2681549 RepID=UPI0012E80119|nr:hypothetical protein [Sphingomonas profundi]
MTMLALAAVAASAALIVALCLGDPKRRRSARLRGDGHRTTTRRLIAAAICAPGAICVVRGDAAAFLIWLGACGVIGWFVTLCFARQRSGG